MRTAIILILAAIAITACAAHDTAETTTRGAIADRAAYLASI